MLKETLTVSALISVILLVRAVFRNRVPKRMIYGLWLIVLLRLCLPGTLISLPILPPEEKIAPVHAAAAQPAEISEQTAPAVQMPTQTASANQQPSPAIPPITQPQEALKPAEKVLTSVQVLQLIWVCGSVLLGLWMLVSWLVFLIRLRKDRSFLGRHGKTCIYVSGAVKSPCLAGLIPAVYLTQDVLKNETTELILRHELMHLRHLDFLWTFCRTAAVIAYWWNPFVWAASIASKQDAELACDEAVAAKLDASARLAYARAILALAPRKQAALSLAGSPVKERILFLTKKQRTSVLCVILTLGLVVSAAGCSVTELTQKKSGEITLPEQSVEDAPVKDGLVLDADTLTDEKLLEIVLMGEIALAGENSFTFDDPRGLSSQELYLLFLAFSDYDELTHDCLDETSGDYIISATYISEKLTRYFKAFDFDITKVRDYSPEKDAVVTKQVSGFGGDRFTSITEKTIDGNLVTLTLDFFDNWEKTGNPYMRKTYALEFYDGGYYYLSAQANHAPQRTAMPKAEESPAQSEDPNPSAFTGGITLYAGSKTALVNSKPVQMPAAPFVENGIFYIPLQFVSETMGWTYQEQDGVAVLRSGSSSTTLTVGERTISIDGTETAVSRYDWQFPNDDADCDAYVPLIRSESVFIPLSFLSDQTDSNILSNLNFGTQWFPEENYAILSGNGQEDGLGGFYIWDV